MLTARCAYPPEQLVPIDHADCWIEPCRTCRNVEEAFRAALILSRGNPANARRYREIWMSQTLRAEELRGVENGVHEIALEPPVVSALVAFADRIWLPGTVIRTALDERTDDGQG